MHSIRLPMVRALLLIVLACGTVNAREDLYTLDFHSGDRELDVIDGVPYLLRKGERMAAGNAIDIKEKNKLVHLGTGRLLSYPLDGDEPFVTLDGKGTRWELGRILKDSEIPVKAAEGKFAGWYLDWSEKEVELERDGVKLHGRRLILVEKPKTPRIFSAYVVAP